MATPVFRVVVDRPRGPDPGDVLMLGYALGLALTHFSQRLFPHEPHGAVAGVATAGLVAWAFSRRRPR